jgi:hypothetical protein
MWRLCCELWRQRTSCCVMTVNSLTLPFSPGDFWSKTTWLLSPTHPTFLCFSDWRYTVEVTETESQAVLNTLTEHPPYFSLFLWLKIHSWGDRDRIAGDAEHPHKTLLQGCN